MSPRSQKIKQALGLLMLCKDEALSPKSAIELIELITNIPEIQREVLQEAQNEGIIRKEKNRLVIQRKTPPSENFHYPRVEKKICEGRCEKCGRSITSCYIILLSPSDMIGPFGSDCIKKMRLI